MSPEIFKSKEKAPEALPESTRKLLDGIMNDVGVREHLGDSKSFDKGEAEEWDKSVEDRMTRLNKEIADNHLTRDQIMRYLKKTETREVQKRGNKFYENLHRRFWIDEYYESPTLQINHFFKLDGNLARALMSHHIDGGKGETADMFLKELNTAIENVRPRPVAGELERWVKSTGASRMFDVIDGRLAKKASQSSEK